MTSTSRAAAEKEDAARRSLAHVQPGMLVGLGSGRTATRAIELLGEAVRGGLDVRAIASSHASAALARRQGIRVLEPDELTAADVIDVVIDGADEVDPDGRLIKGGGGALFREKVLATHTRALVITVDGSKLVPALGAFPLPVEIVPFARLFVERTLSGFGLRPALRMRGDVPYLTDQGNWILDCGGGPFADPDLLAARLDGVVGVVEHGLFVGLRPTVIIGRVP